MTTPSSPPTSVSLRDRWLIERGWFDGFNPLLPTGGAILDLLAGHGFSVRRCVARDAHRDGRTVWLAAHLIRERVPASAASSIAAASSASSRRAATSSAALARTAAT